MNIKKAISRLLGYHKKIIVKDDEFLTVTWAGDEIVLVSMQNEEGRILWILAEKGCPRRSSTDPVGLNWY